MNIDSFKSAIVDSVIHAIQHDSTLISSKIVASQPSTQTPIYLFAAALFGSIVGSLVTIWSKKKDLKNELNKMQQVRAEYQLNLNKFEHAKYEKFLSMSDSVLTQHDKDKLEFIKALNGIVRDIQAYFPPSASVNDNFEAEEIIAMHIYSHSKQYKARIENIIRTYPYVFPEKVAVLSKIKSVIDNIEFDISDASGHEPGDLQDILISMTKEIMEVFNKLERCYKESVEEINLYQTVRDNFVREQMKRGT